jgi:hypothetical protein
VNSRTFTVASPAPGAGEVGHITLPFDAKAVWGKARAPVVVEVNGHRFRSTVAVMGGEQFVPFRRSAREAAGVADGDGFTVTLTPDDAPRTVDAPADLRTALEAAGAWARWEKLSYTHQREHAEAIEGAKKPETRAKRIAACVAKVGG